MLLTSAKVIIKFEYTMDYFYNALHENFSDIEFADFSDLEIPDEYRYDPHHLNMDGAEYFTKVLMERYNIK